MPSNHAILAPSAAKRWMTCAPSARMEEKFPSKDTAYTREGTIAHAIGEELLKWLYQSSSFVPDFPVLLKDITENAPNMLTGLQEDAKAEGLDFAEMLKTVYEGYVSIVFNQYLLEKNADPETELLVEAELKLDDFIPEGFGSSDAVVIGNNTLHVFDLKYGKGVKVSAEHNPQMMCYALGALYGPAEPYNILYVQMHILQPRLNHWSHFTLGADVLSIWGKCFLKPAAEKAFNGKGHAVPGEHCQFCRVAPRCKALKAYTMTIETSQEGSLMTDEELGETLTMLGTAKTYIAHLEDYVLAQLQAGRTIPGWKVVEGRSLRKIQNTMGAIEALVEAGFEPNDYFKPAELKTISDLEKLVGKKQFNTLLGEFVVKPAGKPTLAPADDPRPAFSTAEADFGKEF